MGKLSVLEVEKMIAKMTLLKLVLVIVLLMKL